MNLKTKKIVGWSLSVLVALMLIASAIDKIIGSAHALQMSASFGISGNSYATLGIIELVSALLFLYSRTGILGCFLLSSYLGGGIATHLQHGQGILFPAAIEALVWIAAVIRFPELLERILAISKEKHT